MYARRELSQVDSNADAALSEDGMEEEKASTKGTSYTCSEVVGPSEGAIVEGRM